MGGMAGAGGRCGGGAGEGGIGQSRPSQPRQRANWGSRRLVEQASEAGGRKMASARRFQTSIGGRRANKHCSVLRFCGESYQIFSAGRALQRADCGKKNFGLACG